MSKDEAQEWITTTFGGTTWTGLTDSVWKERLGAVTEIQQAVASLDVAADGGKVCLALSHVPGWKDSNFQVRSGRP
jgi:hypothetical protein